MAKLLIIFALIILLVIAGKTLGQPVDAEHNGSELAARVDQLFADVNNDKSPGAALLVIKDSQIIYRKNFGMADLASGKKIADSTVFSVGSISKQFTAMAVQLLVTDRKISLDDDVRKYIPELHNFGRPILIRHLLNHTSGLREQLQLLFMAGWRLEDLVSKTKGNTD